MIAREPRDSLELVAQLREARARTLALVEDLAEPDWLGPRLAIVNPTRWELGHVAWFQEKWCRRHLHGHASLRPDADALYDSTAVLHETRWDLALPDRAGTLAYARAVLQAVTRELEQGEPLGREARDLHLLALYHEDMHGEAFVYTRQTHALAAPRCSRPSPPIGGPCPGDVSLPGGRFRLGAEPGDGFVFDNERWAHEVEIAPFRIARACVTQAEFAEFVEDGGYERDALWSVPGRAWRAACGATLPVYWRRATGGGFERRCFRDWLPLEQHLPVHCVNAHEAEAFSTWAGRRLPSEAEWEFAAGPAHFPWGDEPPTHAHAALDLESLEPCAVGEHAAGDSPQGVRQLIGNVWEWTATTFGPYPGFAPGPYREYSAPWFGDHRVLRGGSFATRARLLRKTWRNFYTPERRDVLAGFRTCAR